MYLMKKNWLSLMTALILMMILATGCANTSSTPTGDDSISALPIDPNAGTEETYYITGELMEISDDLGSVLIDGREPGYLVWVSLEEPVSEELMLHSIVQVEYDGAIAESYPGQARGFNLVVLEEPSTSEN